MKLGIVGLPNVGKSTLFNAITNAGVPADNYAFPCSFMADWCGIGAEVLGCGTHGNGFITIKCQKAGSDLIF